VHEQRAGQIAGQAMSEWQNGCSTWWVESATEQDGLWLVVLSDEDSKHYATVVVTDEGDADLVCVQDYTPARHTAGALF
jgi:hypothetical protein